MWPGEPFRDPPTHPPKKPEATYAPFEMQRFTIPRAHIAPLPLRKVPFQDLLPATPGPSILRRFTPRHLAIWMAALSSLFLANAFAVTLPDVTLVWNPNSETNISGYELRYGTTPGTYPNSISTGSKTSAVVSGLQAGVSYYFVVHASNSAGMKSSPSAEVTYRVNASTPTTPPPPTKPTPPTTPTTPPTTPTVPPVTPGAASPVATITAPASDLTITAGGTVAFNGKASNPGKKTTLTCQWDFGSESGMADNTKLKAGNQQFNVPGIYTVNLTVKNSSGGSHTTSRKITVVAPNCSVVSRDQWQLKYVDSQETAGYAATASFDGNTDTFWSTAWKATKQAPPPHEIQINLGVSTTVSGFRYVPRQDSLKVGNIAKYEFYVSKDGVKWGSPVATGVLANSNEMKQIFCTPKAGKFVRLRQLTEANGNSDCSMAEFYVLQPAKAASAASTTTVLASAAPAPQMETVINAPARITPVPMIALVSPSETPATATTTETAVISGQKYLVLTYTKPIIPDGITPTVQVSSDLLEWFSGNNHTTVLTDNASILKVRDNTPITSEEKRYIRLKPQVR